jgi:hypothetical protein
MIPAEFSTRSLQLAIFLVASESLPYLRTEPGEGGRVNFIFADAATRGPQLQLEYNRGAAVSARDLFAAQTFVRQAMSSVTENPKTGDPRHEQHSRRR